MRDEAPKSAGITLALLAATGRLVIIQCSDCPNRRHCRPSDLDLRMDTPVSLAGSLLKCCDRGSTRVLTYPGSNRDARKGRVR
jgi:hypothetical protein